MRLGQNVEERRVHLPFWFAIPLWLLVAAAWIVVALVYATGWLLVQGFRLSASGIESGIDAMSMRREMRQAAPIVRGAPDIATARMAVAATVGRWRGPVRNVRRGWGRLQFEVIDPDRTPRPTFELHQWRRVLGLLVPWGLGTRTCPRYAPEMFLKL